MKKRIFYFFILLMSFLAPKLEALSRDFEGYSYEYETYFCHDCVKFFGYFEKKKSWNEFDIYLHLIPTNPGKLCVRCQAFFKLKKDGIYAPYVCKGSQDNFEFLQDHLMYCAQNTLCQCYWPEKSVEAAIISDRAYKLFIELFNTTALSVLVTDEEEQKSVLLSRPSNAHKFSNKGLVTALIGKSFFFSHFYRICQDLDQYSKLKFSDLHYSIIQNKIENIIDDLAICYLKLYQSCYLKHQNQRIFQEYRFTSQLFDTPDRWPTATNKADVGSYTNLTALCLKSFNVSLDLDDATGIETTLAFELDEINSISNLNSSIKENFATSFQRDGFSTNDNLYKNLNQNRHQIKAVNNDKTDQIYWLNSKLLLGDGSLMNDLMLYKTAITLLTASIKANPKNKEAFIERSFAYFETNQLSLALQDFESAKKLTIVPPFRLGSRKAMNMAYVYIPENKTEFSKGLISGTIDGAKISAEEFIPSIFSCCRGILNGLWAFVCSPKEISQEMINTTYAIGEFFSSHSTEECFHCIVPELKELSLTWNKINDYSRGQKIGYIIGKYGIDIFAPAGALKGIHKIRALKRANTMYTLECCAASQAKQAKILEESFKRALKRENIITESIKNSKILVRNSNTQIHIIQPKHNWNKLIKVSGNVEEDCKTVIKLLEDNQIFLEKYRLKSTETFEKLIRYNHEMTINGHKVKAIFNKNLETGEMFLNDAWVIIK